MTLNHAAKQTCVRPACVRSPCTGWTVIVVAVALLNWGCQANPQAGQHPASDSSHVAAKSDGASRSTPVPVIARAGSVRGYPCNQCHDKVPAPIALKAAGERKHQVIPKHFAGADSCHVCHSASNMDSLAMLNGETVKFDESYKLCGQCHSAKLKDFEIGAHGKSVGDWAGARQRYSCVQCHDPHEPARGTTQALPAPPFPARGIHKGQH